MGNKNSIKSVEGENISADGGQDVVSLEIQALRNNVEIVFLTIYLFSSLKSWGFQVTRDKNEETSIRNVSDLPNGCLFVQRLPSNFPPSEFSRQQCSEGHQFLPGQMELA